VFLFVAYAVAVWFAAFHYRRRLHAVPILFVTVGVLWAVIHLHGRIATLAGIGHLIPVFRSIMWAYTAIVAAGAVFLATLPRVTSLRPCRLCGYELSGVADEASACPECGATPEESATPRGRKQVRRRQARIANTPTPAIAGISLSPDQPPGDPGGEQQQRHAAGERPANG
jgi:hypothetical protein